jgi:hypothetical protein
MDYEEKKSVALGAQRLVRELINKDSAKKFYASVTEASFGPLYTSIVSPLPRSLSEIMDKVNKLEYHSIRQIVEDCEYLFTSVYNFVKNDPELTKHAWEMTEFLSRQAPKGTTIRQSTRTSMKDLSSNTTARRLEDVYETLEYHERKLDFFGEQIAKLRALPDNIFKDFTEISTKSTLKRVKQSSSGKELQDTKDLSKHDALIEAKEVLGEQVVEPEKRISEKQKRAVSQKVAGLSEKQIKHVIGILKKYNSRALKRPSAASDNEDEYDVDFETMENPVFDKVRSYINRAMKAEEKKKKA